MRFKNLSYLHTDHFEDEGLKEVKFSADFKDKELENNTIEIWKDDDVTGVLLVCNFTNDTELANDEEEKYVLKYAMENNLL